MATFDGARAGDLYVVLQKKDDGIYSRRFSLETGQAVAFSDGSTEKKVIDTSDEFALVELDQGMLELILLSDRSLWISRDAGESFEQVNG